MSRLRSLVKAAKQKLHEARWRWVPRQSFWPSLALLTAFALLYRGRLASVQEWSLLVQTAAILIAGIWTYYLFILGRQDFPNTSMEHEVLSYSLSGQWTLIRVTVTVKNVSRVLVQLRRAEVHLRQVRPVPLAVAHGLLAASEAERREGRIPNVVDQTGTIAWREVGYREVCWGKHETELEPGETDEFSFDFVVDPDVKLLEIVSSFDNDRPYTPDAWVNRSLYSLEVNDGKR